MLPYGNELVLGDPVSLSFSLDCLCPILQSFHRFFIGLGLLLSQLKLRLQVFEGLLMGKFEGL